MSGAAPGGGTDPGYFERMWGASDDPWDHAGRFSEARKYDLTVAVLGRPRYRRAFEPGCGVGLLTARLADRCDELLAWDRHPRAVAATARRTAPWPHVSVEEGQLPAWPEGSFDLVVLSEVLYYLASDELDLVLDRAATAVPAGGELVAVHFRPVVPEHVRTGDEVHQRLGARSEWDRRAHHLEEGFVLESFRRR